MLSLVVVADSTTAPDGTVKVPTPKAYARGEPATRNLDPLPSSSPEEPGKSMRPNVNVTTAFDPIATFPAAPTVTCDAVQVKVEPCAIPSPEPVNVRVLAVSAFVPVTLIVPTFTTLPVSKITWEFSTVIVSMLRSAPPTNVFVPAATDPPTLRLKLDV
ncbi:MAG: hypothetical protein AABZ01_07735 [Gemmatimonadota bacterium]